MDCFVALLLAITKDMRSRSRGADSTRGLHQLHPLQKRGRRESRAPIAPAVVRKKRTSRPQVNRITPAFLARMVYGLLRALPGDRAFLPPSPRGLMIHREPGWAGCISARL